jgi:hypothetical protein
MKVERDKYHYSNDHHGSAFYPCGYIDMGTVPDQPR